MFYRIDKDFDKQMKHLEIKQKEAEELFKKESERLVKRKDDLCNQLKELEKQLKVFYLLCYIDIQLYKI